jgi:lipoic acid synthetase
VSAEVLHVRWLGRVRYRDALALQRGLWRASGGGDWLLLQEHPSVFTLGVRARPEHLLVDPAAVGAEAVRVDRGGDVTYHGPGQLVGYLVLSVPSGPGSIPAHIHRIEELVIRALDSLGLEGAGRLEGYPGVWVDPQGSRPRKICAIGVRVSKGRSMHGFALNVDPDMARFSQIVPCGLAGMSVTSLAAEGIASPMRSVVDAVVEQAPAVFGHVGVDRADVAWPGDPTPAAHDAGVRKPDWLRAKAHLGEEYRSLKRTVRDLDLVTVCEEAGCPNIYECWADGTATFMINGSRCTRACRFCLVDTSRPLPLDPGEPERVAEAVERLGLAHAVVTTVARDDLPDGGASAFARTVAAIRRRCPRTAVELLISDCRGDPAALETIFLARPDVLNHNIETVARLQRAVRPSASYARSLAVLSRAKEAGLLTKSGLMVGLGESFDEVVSTMVDLHGVGVDVVTIGQYLRPSAEHLPVARWWRPDELTALAAVGKAMGIPHVEASPLTRSSYHARQAVEGVAHRMAAVAGSR